MQVCVFLWERPGVELDIVAVEEILSDVRRLIWPARVFGISGDIDASQYYLAPLAVAKLPVFDLQAKRRHDERFSSLKLITEASRRIRGSLMILGRLGGA